MQTVQVKVVAPIDYEADSRTKLGVFLNGDLIGIYLVHVDDDCDALDYLDLREYSPQKRTIQGCLRGYAYHAKSMGEQIAADLAMMGYETEGNWIADPLYYQCMYCSGYSEHLSTDYKRCADRKCILLRFE